MIAQDIVNRLSATIPLYTDSFSNSVGIVSITTSGGSVATVTTQQPHRLAENQNVAITGAQAPVFIDTTTFLRTGSQAVFSTLQDHDLTLSQRDLASGGKTITITGANESQFTGDFVLIRVVNRRNLIIAVANSGPTTITGQPMVVNANGGIFNGLVKAMNVTSDTFTYNLPSSYPVNAVVNLAKVQTSIRITSVLDIEQYLVDIHTKKTIGDNVLVVQLGDVTQSKKRNELTDASSSSAGEDSFTPVLIQPFSIYIVQNVTDDLTGSEARDKVESEYVPAIFKSLLRAQFNSRFTATSNRCTFTGHGVFAFATIAGKNKAVYAHEVTFEQLAQLVRSDMVGPDDDIAMRDIQYTLNTDPGTDPGTGQFIETIDLDEEPL